MLCCLAATQAADVNSSPSIRGGAAASLSSVRSSNFAHLFNVVQNNAKVASVSADAKMAKRVSRRLADDTKEDDEEDKDDDMDDMDDTTDDETPEPTQEPTLAPSRIPHENSPTRSPITAPTRRPTTHPTNEVSACSSYVDYLLNLGFVGLLLLLLLLLILIIIDVLLQDGTYDDDASNVVSTTDDNKSTDDTKTTDDNKTGDDDDKAVSSPRLKYGWFGRLMLSLIMIQSSHTGYIIAAIVFGVLAAVIIGLVIYSAVTKKSPSTTALAREEVSGVKGTSSYGATGGAADEVHPLLRPSGGR